MPAAADKYGDLLKLVQISFYSIAAIITVLTYLAARRGLLNTVNTEYQKRVMDRLQRLSEDLYSEFDPSSENYWPKVQPVDEALKRINSNFDRHKKEILTHGESFGIPVTQDILRLQRLLDPVISDPFVPDNIREAVVDLLETRLNVLQSIYIAEFEQYERELAEGKHGPWTKFEDVGALHNRIVDKQRLQGCAVDQIESDVHDIRGLIQDYFDSFNPQRGWWQRRRRQPGKRLRSIDAG
jgi:hypothetical protein